MEATAEATAYIEGHEQEVAVRTYAGALAQARWSYIIELPDAEGAVRELRAQRHYVKKQVPTPPLIPKSITRQPVNGVVDVRPSE